jgi:hypothetical protein
MNVFAFLEDHSDSDDEPTEEPTKFSEVRDTLDLVITYTNQTSTFQSSHIMKI